MNIRHRREGFTLLEVSLVTVVGLVLIAGVYYGYMANKDQAGNAIARKRLLTAQATIEAYAADHQGKYPVSGTGTFSKAWADAHPDERGQSPWGGPTGGDGQGAVEDAPITSGTTEATAAPDITADFDRDETRHANLHYLQIEGSEWVKVTTGTVGEPKAYKGYILSIYDRQGNPFLDAVGVN